MTAPRKRRYSLEPLLAATGWTLDYVRTLAPCNGDEYAQRRQHGVSEVIADRLATAAGLHLHILWPEAQEIDHKTCPHCGCSFLPNSPKQRFCRDQCRKDSHRRNPDAWQRHLDRRRRYYAENGDYERARQRRADRERRARERANRQLESGSSRTMETMHNDEKGAA